MSTARYPLPGGDLEIRGEIVAFRTFLDSFLGPPRKPGGGRSGPTIIEVSVVPARPDASEPAVIIGAAAVRSPSRASFEVSSHGTDSDLTLYDFAAVLRRLVREVWLDVQAAAAFQLHASAVIRDRTCIVFTGDKRSGKTTLMADAVTRHGFSLVTNDGLVLTRHDGAAVIAPFPTLAKVRGDTARRHQRWIERAVADDPFNRAQVAAWRDGPPLDDDNSLFLTFTVFGHAFVSYPLTQLDLVIVDAGFHTPGEAVTVTRLEPGTALLRRNEKPMHGYFSSLIATPAADPVEVEALVRELAGNAGLRRFRHQGCIEPLLAELAGTGGGVPFVGGALTGHP